MRKNTTLMKLLCLVLCLALLAAGCGNHGSTTSAEGQEVTFSVTLMTEGGMLLADLPVYIYTDDTLEELVWFSRTDDQGSVIFQGTSGSNYAVVIQEAPTGYHVENCYIISEENSQIVIGADMESQVNATDYTYGLGDAVYNFSVTTPDGTVYTIYDLLAQYNAVVLNFWYSNCGPCKAEFPYIQSAYEQYGEDIIVLAMNPVDGTDNAVSEFQSANGLTFPMVNCDAAWVNAMQIEAYPTTVVIDRYGTICLIHSGSVTEEGVFESLFQYFTAEDYVQTLISDLSQFAPSGSGGEDDAGSSADNPLELGAVESFDVTLDAGQEMYYHLYKVSQMILKIESADAYVIYKDETYYPENGVVSLQLDALDPSEPAAIIIGNSGEGESTFVVTLSNPAGSYGNPYTLELGDFTVELEEGNERGLYYTYTATASGDLTVQIKRITSGVEGGVVLYNLSSGAYRIMEADGTEENGVKTLSVAVKPGDTVQVIVSTVPDRSFYYPAATISLSAEMRSEDDGGKDDEPVVQDITYTIIVVDGNGKAVSGVTVTVDTGVNLIELTTNSSGKITVDLPADTYEVTLTVPNGYSATSTTFRMSEKSPNLTIDLTKMVTYTVTVTDADGKAVSEAKITIGTKSVTTDSSGKASAELPSGTYAVTLTSIPSGYSAATTGFQITADKPNLAIKLTKAESAVETVQYTVKVVETVTGKGISGVTVTVNGVSNNTNNSGVATFTIPRGSYTATITIPNGYSGSSSVNFDGGTTVTAKLMDVSQLQTVDTSTSETVYVNGTDFPVYVIGTGLYECALTPGSVTYLEFTPDTAGEYTFTVVSGSASIGQSGTTFYTYEPLNPSNSYTQTISGGSVVVGVKAAAGATSAIISIARTGNISAVTSITYTGTHTPSAYTFSGGELTYVDITAAASDYTLVKDASGFYHLGSASGPLMYVNLLTNPYDLSLSGILEYGGVKIHYDSEGNIASSGSYTKVVDYTACLQSYVDCKDKSGVYPLTDDLINILKNYGEQQQWWRTIEVENGNIAGHLLDLEPNLNTEIAWMFSCCYVK